MKDHLFAAGESGNVPIVPGKADESRIVKMLEGKGEFADSIMARHGIPEDMVRALQNVARSFRGWGSRAPGARPPQDGGLSELGCRVD